MGKIWLATDSAVARQMLRLRLSVGSPKDSMTAGAGRLGRHLKKQSQFGTTEYTTQETENRRMKKQSQFRAK